MSIEPSASSCGRSDAGSWFDVGDAEDQQSQSASAWRRAGWWDETSWWKSRGWHIDRWEMQAAQTTALTPTSSLVGWSSVSGSQTSRNERPRSRSRLSRQSGRVSEYPPEDESYRESSRTRFSTPQVASPPNRAHSKSRTTYSHCSGGVGAFSASAVARASSLKTSDGNLGFRDFFSLSILLRFFLFSFFLCSFLGLAHTVLFRALLRWFKNLAFSSVPWLAISRSSSSCSP